MTLTIFQKGVILVALPLIAQGIFVAILAQFQARYADAEYWSRHTKEVLDLGRRVEGQVIETQSSVRGYVLTGDRSFLNQEDQWVAAAGQAADRLIALVADRPAQQDRARRIAERARAAAAWQFDTVRVADTGDTNAATRRIQSADGKRLVDELRAELTEFLHAEEQLDAERELALEQARRTFTGLLLAGVVATFVGTVGLALFFSRGISRRLAVLAENTRRLAAGRELAAEVGGTDEIAQVDRAFRAMAAEVRSLGHGLEARVRERTAELDRANAALRAEEERFRSAFDNTNVAMVLTDLDNRFIRANAAFARMFGYSDAEVLGLTMADITHPDHLAESYEQRVRLLAGEIPFFHMEKRYRHKDGRILWGLTNVSLVRDAAGRPHHYVGQVQDITLRKAAEAVAKAHGAELAETNRDLALKNQENELFVYSVSHDLRSPLVNLQGFSKELGKGCEALRKLLADERVPAEAREPAVALLNGRMTKALGFIQTAVTRLGNIIDALLRLSRAGRVEYRWESVDMARIVGQVVTSLQGTIGEKQAVVRVGELPRTTGDATALGQVFANLLGNALGYLDPKRPGEIEVGGAAADGGVTYWVRDNGLGIPAAHHQKVFQLFQRVHPGVGSGEGLGLAIVARVVERHRGKVWVESQEGAGSTFFVRLPATPAGGRGDEPCRPTS